MSFRFMDLPLELQQAILEFTIEPWSIEVRPRELERGSEECSIYCDPDEFYELFGTMVICLDAYRSVPHQLLRVSKHFLQQARPLLEKRFSGELRLQDYITDKDELVVVGLDEAVAVWSKQILPYLDSVSTIDTNPSGLSCGYESVSLRKICTDIGQKVRSVTFPTVRMRDPKRHLPSVLRTIRLEDILSLEFDESGIIQYLHHRFDRECGFENHSDPNTRLFLDIHVDIRELWPDTFLEFAMPGDILVSLFLGKSNLVPS